MENRENLGIEFSHQKIVNPWSKVFQTSISRFSILSDSEHWLEGKRARFSWREGTNTNTRVMEKSTPFSFLSLLNLLLFPQINVHLRLKINRSIIGTWPPSNASDFWLEL
jgi:hypothetical protein